MERETPVFSRWGLEEEGDEDLSLLELLAVEPTWVAYGIDVIPAYWDDVDVEEPGTSSDSLEELDTSVRPSLDLFLLLLLLLFPSSFSFFLSEDFDFFFLRALDSDSEVAEGTGDLFEFCKGANI